MMAAVCLTYSNTVRAKSDIQKSVNYIWCGNNDPNLWSHGYCMECCCFHWNLYLERHWCWFDLMAETVHLTGDW